MRARLGNVRCECNEQGSQEDSYAPCLSSTSGKRFVVKRKFEEADSDTTGSGDINLPYRLYK